MEKKFYKSFEDKFRGDYNTVLERLSIYKDFTKPLSRARETPKAVDLGCGRGEWLESLKEQGFEAVGVDLNYHMTQEIHEFGFEIHTMDALEFLANQPDSSIDLISAFHLIEHLPFDSFKKLVDESHRVLSDAGLLILETPNPENLLVGTETFYFDPTHIKPIPHELTKFLMNYCGFNKVKVLRLQGNEDLLSSETPSLYETIAGVSRDYGVIGQKIISENKKPIFNEEFKKNYGISMQDALNLYEQRSVEKANEIKRELKKIEQSSKKVSKEIKEIKNHQTKLDNQEKDLKQVISTLQSVHQSTSWAITKPFRKIGDLSKAIKQVLKVTLLKTISFLLQKTLLKKLFSNYQFRKLISFTLKKYPNLDSILRNIVFKYNTLKIDTNNIRSVQEDNPEKNYPIKNTHISHVDFFEIDVDQSICEIYKLNFNLRDIRHIRETKSIRQAEGSKLEIQRIIEDIYLSLLYRFPSTEDINHYTEVINSTKSFDAVIDTVINSKEFEINGLKEV